VEELNGLVYGMAIADDREAPEDEVWYRRPALLGFGAVVIGVVLCIIFF
jgi:SSS family solute:Na+ symporter